MAAQEKPVIIMGAGQAGAQAAISLRQKEGYQGRLIMLGEEAHLPYQRPPLSKKFLVGEEDESHLWLRPASFWEKLGVELMPAMQVKKVDLGRHELLLGEGQASLFYDRLVWTTGGHARSLPIEGADLPELHRIRTLDDARTLGTALRGKSGRLGIVGAGYIGLEVAASARKLGWEVVVYESAPRPLARTTSEFLGQWFQQKHTSEGVQFMFGKQLQAVRRTGKEGQGLEFHFDDGEKACVDFGLLAVGLAPASEMAEAAGLPLLRGRIITDLQARTADADCWAAGDCASAFSPLVDANITLESVQNAIDQAKIAAAAMMGNPLPPPAIPWFWSDQYDVSLRQAGLASGDDDILMRGDPESGSFCLFYLKDGKLQAVDCLNRAAEFMAVRQALARKISVPATILQDESIAPKDWLKASA